jgi:hypothetical protein
MYTETLGEPGPGDPDVRVAEVVDIAVVAPAGVRLHTRSLTGLLVHAPALADQNAELPFTCTVHARLACTLSVTGVNDARPLDEFMSVVAAVYVEVVGDTVICNSAGFTIVAGKSSVTVGEHLPELPLTLQTSTVCAAAVDVANKPSIAIMRTAIDRSGVVTAFRPITAHLGRAFRSAACS